MDEHNPEITPVAIGQPIDEYIKKGPTTTLILAIVGSLIIGAGGVLAAFYLAPEWFVTPKTAHQITNPSVTPSLDKPAGNAAALYTPDKGTPAPGLTPDPLTNPTTTDPGTTPPTEPPKTSEIPSQPVPGNWKPGDQPPVTGPITPGGLSTSPVSPPVPGDLSTQSDKPEGNLVSARSSGGDVEVEGQEIVKALRSAGASVRSSPHFSLSGSMVGYQVIATVPAKSLSATLEKLKTAGVRISDEWKGPIDERRSIVSGMISSRISSLRSLESALKEKYEDDAVEIVSVREEIENLEKALSLSRNASSPGIAIIVVGVGAL